MRIRSTLVSVAVLLLAGGAHAELVTNGGFEDRFNEYDAPGWSIVAGTGTVSFAKVSEYFTCCTLSGTYPNGNDTGAAFFGWDNLQGGDLEQVLTTVAGQRYTVSFDYGAISIPAPQSLRVSVFGNMDELAWINVSAMGTGNLGAMMTGYQFSFTATSGTTTLLFSDTSLGTLDVDGVLDNVSVTAVPEPATQALFLAGLALMGAITRRLKR